MQVPSLFYVSFCMVIMQITCEDFTCLAGHCVLHSVKIALKLSTEDLSSDSVSQCDMRGRIDCPQEMNQVKGFIGSQNQIKQPDFCEGDSCTDLATRDIQLLTIDI